MPFAWIIARPAGRRLLPLAANSPAINTIAYADIDQRRMSRATSLVSVAQQLSISAGVAIGALAVDLTLQWRGHAITAADFQPAFLMIALISACAFFVFVRLPRRRRRARGARRPCRADRGDGAELVSCSRQRRGRMFRRRRSGRAFAHRGPSGGQIRAPCLARPTRQACPPSRAREIRSPAHKARPNSARLAAGLTCFTLAKSRLSAASSALSVPPWITLARNAPPGLQHLARRTRPPPRPAP